MVVRSNFCACLLLLIDLLTKVASYPSLNYISNSTSAFSPRTSKTLYDLNWTNGSVCTVGRYNGAERSNFTGTVATPCDALCTVPPLGQTETYWTACSCSSLFDYVANEYGTTLTAPAMLSLGLTFPTTIISDSAYTPPDDCCPLCWITAEDVQVLYWPVVTSAIGANGTIVTPKPTQFGQVSDGNTFTSPSAYVAYRNLGAYAYCSPFPSAARGKIYNTTIAYDQDELSTTQGEYFYPQMEKGSGTAINFTEWQSSLPKYSPMFSLPAELSALDPTWNTCLPKIYGALDPPRTLAKVTALVSPDAATHTYSTAVPGARVGPANTPATVTAAAINTENENSRLVSDSGGGDPGGPSANNQNIDQATSKGQRDPTGTPQNSQNFHPANSKSAGDLAGVLESGQSGDPAEIQTVSTSTINNDPSIRLLEDIPVQTVAEGSIIINGATLGPGNRLIHEGASQSVGNDRIIIDGTLYHLPTSKLSAPLIIDGQSITRASNGGIILGSSTVPLGSPATIASHTITPFSSFVIVDGVPHALPTRAGAILSQPSNPQPPITAITLANGAIITQGGPPAIISQTTYFLPVSATALLVNGKPITSATALPTSVFTIAGPIFTANPTAFAIGGQSLSIGDPAITLSGTVVSLGSAGLRIGSSTVALDAAQESGNVRLGDVIMAGFGSGASAARGNGSGAGPVAFTGVAGRREVGGRSMTLLIVFGVCICVAMV